MVMQDSFDEQSTDFLHKLSAVIVFLCQVLLQEMPSQIIENWPANFY